MDALDRHNSFTAIRQLLAVAVVLAHAFYLGGFGEDPLYEWSGQQFTGGGFAVLCFFVISGYLITASAERQPIWRFCVHRCVRILPGFWAVQLLTAFALAPILILAKYDRIEGYWDAFALGENSAGAYLWNNAFVHIKQYTITGLFNEPLQDPTVNGSLWSLGPEITCYLYLAVFAIFGGLRFTGLSLGVFLATYALFVGATFDPSIAPPVAEALLYAGVPKLEFPQFRTVYMAFVAGMVFYKFRDYLRWNLGMFLVCVLTLIASLHLRSFDLIWPLALPYVVLYLGHVLPVRGFDRYGDFSFGIYIFSFPIQQCLRLWDVNEAGLFVYATLSVLLSILAGVLSWFLIEAPAMRWAKRLGRRTQIIPPPSAILNPVALTVTAPLLATTAACALSPQVRPQT